jgi:hypothetical protein
MLTMVEFSRVVANGAHTGSASVTSLRGAATTAAGMLQHACIMLLLLSPNVSSKSFRDACCHTHPKLT